MQTSIKSIIMNKVYPKMLEIQSAPELEAQKIQPRIISE